jgi:hypothetical protein
MHANFHVFWVIIGPNSEIWYKMHHQNPIYILYYVNYYFCNKSFIQAHQLFKFSSILKSVHIMPPKYGKLGACVVSKKTLHNLIMRRKWIFLTYKTSCIKTIISKLDSKKWWYFSFPSLLIFVHSPKVKNIFIDLSLNLMMVHDRMGTWQ